MKISAVMIAKDEEKNIGDAIRSVAWADEVLVVDAESTDSTRDIAASLGARVISRPWPGFSAQKQFATDEAAHDWVFSLDADERVSDDLRAEIESIRSRDEGAVSGYRIPRLSVYMGRQIRHCGWYPDWQLRLFDRRRGRWKDVPVHESVEMEASSRVERLSGDILHYSVESAAEHHHMIGTRYAPLAARRMFDAERRTNPLTIAFAGPVAFVSTYFLKAGFLDGLPGFCISWFAAHHAYLKHLLLWEMQRGDGRR